MEITMELFHSSTMTHDSKKTLPVVLISKVGKALQNQRHIQRLLG